MLVFAEPQKIIRADFPRQAKPFHAQPIPFTRHTLKEVLDWLQPFQNYWNRRIAALNELLDKEKEL